MNIDGSKPDVIFSINSKSKIYFYLIGLLFLSLGSFIIIHGIWFTIYYSNPQVLIFSIPFGMLCCIPGVLFALIPKNTKVFIFDDKILVKNLLKKQIINLKDLKNVDFKKIRMPYGSERAFTVVYRNGDVKKFRLNLYSDSTCEKMLNYLHEKIHNY